MGNSQLQGGSQNQANINSVFWTFQGEGHHWGKRALFVRMPFCNLSCSWCDTTFNTFEKWTKEKFQEYAKSEEAKFAVITGGEPTMNKHTPVVINWLKELGFYIAIESNGNFAIPDGIDWVTVSPKRDADYDIHPDAEKKVDELKYIVDEGFDLSMLNRHEDWDCILSLSPEFNQMQESLNIIYGFIKENPEWKISLQTHKWMNIA